ncbi:MAG: rhomboid family intramembrane serine protease, partial [Flavobacteriales bacterium]|nr:rhomboid family intramembrane serine protease [Flavobacteriales bacterium]
GDAAEFLMQFWGLLTYMFLHAGVMHILFNMLWLYWMGKLIVEYLGQKRFIAIYFLGGLAGGLSYLLVYNMMDAVGSLTMGTHLIGASAGVMAIVIAAAVLLPDYIIHLFLIGPVRLKYVGLGILIITSILDFNVNMGGKLAHLGGAAVGYFFVRQLRSGTDYSVLFFQIVNAFAGLLGRRKAMKVVKSPKKSGSRGANTDGMTEAQRQRKLDDILDKISRLGYDGLTAEEKDFLFRTSRKN